MDMDITRFRKVMQEIRDRDTNRKDTNGHGQGHKQTGTQTDRDTDEQRHRWTGTQVDRDGDTDGDTD
jgi:hypothetical protein